MEASVDEVILALVASGKFTLPEGIIVDHARFGFTGATHNGVDWDVLPSVVHDLCAMRWARDRRAWPQLDYDAYHDAMIRGDSAAAIKALWEACGGTNES